MSNRMSPTERRNGLTFIELMLAMTILAMVVGTLGALARGVQQAYEYTEGQGLATQHARVVFERIAHTIDEANTSDEFPGFIVVSEEFGSWDFPDTLVVWRPLDWSGNPKSARDPDGLPYYDEVVVYAPHPYSPNTLLEMTFPWTPVRVPSLTDVSRWQSEIETLKKAYFWRGNTLTTLVRSCYLAEGSTSEEKWRGAVRFAVRLRPSEDDWSKYLAGTRTWERLPWVQGIYGSRTGLRQNWLRIELQLMPGESVVASPEETYRPVVFFDSIALFYQMQRE